MKETFTKVRHTGKHIMMIIIKYCKIEDKIFIVQGTVGLRWGNEPCEFTVL